jgi:hypothetical protein
MTIYEKIDIALSGWVITRVGMIDKYRYLVITQWNNDDDENPFVREDGKKYNHPTRMMSIDIKNNKIIWNTDYDGYSHGYCDGGIINGNKEAFFGSYNGVTYHLDYGADKFQHEELMMTSKHVKEGTARGMRSIKLLGKHFYTGDSGNEIHRRDAAKTWTLMGKEPNEYRNKFAKGGLNCIDGFSEEEIYFSGRDGTLWVMLGKEWHKISTNPNWLIDNVVCGDDGMVYAVDTRGRVAIGRGTQFELFDVPNADDILPYIWEACVFQGKLYGGGAGGSLMVFKDKVWKPANLPLIGSVENMVAKDGVMFIAGAWTLKIYNGKETQELYGGEKELNELLLKGFMKSATEVLESTDKLLDGMKKP